MRFEKVSFEQFAKDVPLVNVPREKLKEWYDQIICISCNFLNNRLFV